VVLLLLFLRSVLHQFELKVISIVQSVVLMYTGVREKCPDPHRLFFLSDSEREILEEQKDLKEQEVVDFFLFA